MVNKKVGVVRNLKRKFKLLHIYLTSFVIKIVRFVKSFYHLPTVNYIIRGEKEEGEKSTIRILNTRFNTFYKKVIDVHTEKTLEMSVNTPV